mmetsp:Transcript_8604/g.11896  ORF Transcript_8604/g.11896 Transcript_8604/m.11896 type:complete len:302 (-) Transcript_8604:40-945(-)
MLCKPSFSIRAVRQTSRVPSRFVNQVRTPISSTRKFSSGKHDLVICEEDKHGNGVFILKFHNPQALNALTVDMGIQFKSIVQNLASSPKLRCVVLTGSGKAFSAGGDLQFLLDRSNDTPHNNSIMMKQFYERFLAIRTLPVPVISAINGSAVGAGLCVAAATDLRIAAKSAKLGVTFTNLGIHPGMGATHYLPKLVGPQMASWLLLGGDLITAEEAHQMGLVMQVVDDDKVLERSLEIARKLAEKSSVAVRTTLRTLRAAQDKGVEQALYNEAQCQAECYAAPDVKEGVNAIKEKRKPTFH